MWWWVNLIDKIVYEPGSLIKLKVHVTLLYDGLPSLTLFYMNDVEIFWLLGMAQTCAVSKSDVMRVPATEVAPSNKHYLCILTCLASVISRSPISWVRSREALTLRWWRGGRSPPTACYCLSLKGLLKKIYINDNRLWLDGLVNGKCASKIKEAQIL